MVLVTITQLVLTSFSTFLAKLMEVVKSIDMPFTCSACAFRSETIKEALLLPSAKMTTSLGPGSISMPTWPKSCLLAEITYLFPGPMIF